MHLNGQSSCKNTHLRNKCRKTRSYIFCDDLMPWADINKSDFVLQRSIMIFRLIPVVFKFESTMILTSFHINIVPLPMDWSCAERLLLWYLSPTSSWTCGNMVSSFFKPKFTGFSNHSEMDFWHHNMSLKSLRNGLLTPQYESRVPFTHFCR